MAGETTFTIRYTDEGRPGQTRETFPSRESADAAAALLGAAGYRGVRVEPNKARCDCGGDDCAGVNDNLHHQCGGPHEACGMSGCPECLPRLTEREKHHRCARCGCVRYVHAGWGQGDYDACGGPAEDIDCDDECPGFLASNPATYQCEWEGDGGRICLSDADTTGRCAKHSTPRGDCEHVRADGFAGKCNECHAVRTQQGPTYRPGDVVLAPVPLVGTMGRAEVEHAAAMIVRTSQVRGEWYAVTSPDVGRALKADVESGHALAKTWNNPFLRPDFRGLVERGFAQWTGEPFKSPLSFTEAGFGAMRRWVDAPANTCVPPREESSDGR